jgi:hypothetical protein
MTSWTRLLLRKYVDQEISVVAQDGKMYTAPAQREGDVILRPKTGR